MRRPWRPFGGASGDLAHGDMARHGDGDMATFGDITRRHGDLAHGDRRILAKATWRRGDMATWRHLAAGGFHLFGASGSTDETDIL